SSTDEISLRCRQGEAIKYSPVSGTHCDSPGYADTRFRMSDLSKREVQPSFSRCAFSAVSGSTSTAISDCRASGLFITVCQNAATYVSPLDPDFLQPKNTHW